MVDVGVSVPVLVAVDVLVEVEVVVPSLFSQQHQSRPGHVYPAAKPVVGVSWYVLTHSGVHCHLSSQSSSPRHSPSPVYTGLAGINPVQ